MHSLDKAKQSRQSLVCPDHMSLSLSTFRSNVQRRSVMASTNITAALETHLSIILWFQNYSKNSSLVYFHLSSGHSLNVWFQQ
jgi:hypothetical protein